MKIPFSQYNNNWYRITLAEISLDMKLLMKACNLLCGQVATAVADEVTDASTSGGAKLSTSSVASFRSFIKTPKKIRVETTRKRRVGHAQIITSSPYKAILQQSAKACRKLKLGSKGVKQKEQRKATSKTAKTDGSSSSTAADRTPCMFCEILHCESNVDWFKCRVCQQWACGQCAHMGRKKTYLCDSCK